MKNIVPALLMLAATAFCTPALAQGTPDARQTIASWPAESRKVAEDIIKKYGQPKEVTPSVLKWEKTGPWKRTLVYRDPVKHVFPVPHVDVLEQFIDYRAVPDKADELARYDGSVVVARTNGEMSARCDKEGANLLAINLAHDIVTNKRTVENARAFYASTMMNMMKGKMSPYLEKLLFPVATGGTADPDKPFQPKPKAQ